MLESLFNKVERIENGQKMSRVSFEYLIHRISCPEVFCKKAVLRNFAKFTGNHRRQSVFLNKVAVQALGYRCFAVNFAKFLRTSFVMVNASYIR